MNERMFFRVSFIDFWSRVAWISINEWLKVFSFFYLCFRYLIGKNEENGGGGWSDLKRCWSNQNTSFSHCEQ